MPSSPADRIVVPVGTPEPIRRALEVAASCQFCTFLTPVEVTPAGEFAVEARIGPADEVVDKPREGPALLYRVRFLIPRAFPFATVHTVPLEPSLRWYQHQNGDWPWEADAHANVLCPADLNEIHADELLLPHIRHAYTWITDALRGALIRPDERYEFPHLIRSSLTHPIVYVEGGEGVLAWVRGARCGCAWLQRVHDRHAPDGLFRVVKFRAVGERNNGAAWTTHVRDEAFGSEEAAGWAPWVYAGTPVVGKPHQPAVFWKDFPDHIRRRIVDATRDATAYQRVAPILLVAFSIPERWSGGSERVVWAAIALDRVDEADFERPRTGYRPNSDVLQWPAVKRFIARHDPVPWVGVCTDISPEALASRRGVPLPHRLHEPHAVSASQVRDRLEGKPLSRRHDRDLQSHDGGTDEPDCSRGIGDLRIAVIGVGALGSMLAKALAKLDPIDLLLVDKETVEPGNLVRHEALAFQVATGKASAMATLLPPLTSDRQVRSLRANVVHDWDKVVPELEACDLIIDATADSGVHGRLLAGEQLAKTCIAWCYAKPGPDFGVLVLRRAGSALTLEDAELALRDGVDDVLWERFAGGERHEGSLVWPQPGCYAPTFNAPYHRLHMLADMFLTTLESWFAAGCPVDVVTLVQQTQPAGRYGIEQHIVAQLSLPHAGIGDGAHPREGHECGAQ